MSCISMEINKFCIMYSYAFDIMILSGLPWFCDHEKLNNGTLNQVEIDPKLLLQK